MTAGTPWARRCALLGALALGSLGCADDGPTGDDEVGAPETETSPETEGSGESTESTESTSTSTESAESTESTESTDSTETDTTESSETGGGPPPRLPLCGTAPPEGAELAPPLPTYAGECPGFIPGEMNVFDTGGGAREFILVAPTDIREGEELPVMFMYHWLGASANSFFNKAEVQYAADYYRFIAVIPEGREVEDLVPFKWPFAVSDLDFIMEEDFQMFDDVLACVAEQYSVDKECVSAMGVSAGAMFTSMLASRHGERLSSMISLSGGVGGLIKPWQAGGNVMPALVLWGGRDDFCILIDFAVASVELEEVLEANGHPVLECIHNCTHATPPFEVPEDQPELPTFAPAWEFMLAHPYWLEDGYSPYDDYDELPSPWPDWCAMGAGAAMERVGECGGSECQ
ncbi:hypothetical protein PPSIR1_42286 [Plesiocystis pacifica SIR-1]|uniref:Uncharacterized protein n=1 Tax=Plesiocystis pacifica SIR-1 TaxID=391625 RepID=A6GD13_9BACT|nr:hypothetical protein PPSIR1_42286 [Plesiocystis pacifica SIR-1]